MALQVANAACVLGTASDRDSFEEIYYILFFFKKNLYITGVYKKISTGRLG